jgi:hypothetical protein
MRSVVNYTGSEILVFARIELSDGMPMPVRDKDAEPNIVRLQESPRRQILSSTLDEELRHWRS